MDNSVDTTTLNKIVKSIPPKDQQYYILGSKNGSVAAMAGPWTLDECKKLLDKWPGCLIGQWKDNAWKLVNN